MARSNLCKPEYQIRLERLTRKISKVAIQRELAEVTGKGQQAISKNIHECSFSLTDLIRILDAYPEDSTELLECLVGRRI